MTGRIVEYEFGELDEVSLAYVTSKRTIWGKCQSGASLHVNQFNIFIY